MADRLPLSCAEFEGIDTDSRSLTDQVNTYVSNVPCEMIENFDSKSYPIIVG